MSPAEWLQLNLGGDANCAIGMATGTGLFNPRKLRWDKELLDRLEVRVEQLRPLSDEAVSVDGPLAQIVPELQGVPWFPAIGDGRASNLGSAQRDRGWRRSTSGQVPRWSHARRARGAGSTRSVLLSR